MFIYCVENILNGKLYIGQTYNPELREQSHLSGSSGCVALTNAIRKYDAEVFEFVLLERCISQEELDEREAYWISVLNTQVPNGYNIKSGGAGGGPCAQETRIKISKAHKGRKKSPEHMEALRQSHLGKPLSEEHKEKLRQINLGKIMPKEAVEKTRQFWIGRKHSEESKKKMSESSKGFRHTDQSKEKIRAVMLGRVYSPETLEKMSESAKNRAPISADTREKMSISHRKDTCKEGHPLIDPAADVYFYNGVKICRPCRRMRIRRWRKGNK